MNILGKYIEREMERLGLERRYLWLFGVLSVLVGLVFLLLPLHPVLSFLLGYLLTQATVLGVLSYLVSARSRAVEDVLPDILQFISSSLRAGLTVDRAFLEAASRRFGSVSRELERVGREIVSGVPVGEALRRWAWRMKSRTVDRVVFLIEEGMKSGGDLPRLLSAVASDLRYSQIFSMKLRAMVRSYTMFLILSGVVIAPLLFSLTLTFVEVSNKLKELMTAESEGEIAGIQMLRMGEEIPVDDLRSLFFLLISGTSFFTALLISVINTGSERESIKYVIPFLLLANFLFFAGYSLSRSMILSITGL